MNFVNLCSVFTFLLLFHLNLGDEEADEGLNQDLNLFSIRNRRIINGTRISKPIMNKSISRLTIDAKDTEDNIASIMKDNNCKNKMKNTEQQCIERGRNNIDKNSVQRIFNRYVTGRKDSNSKIKQRNDGSLKHLKCNEECVSGHCKNKTNRKYILRKNNNNKVSDENFYNNPSMDLQNRNDNNRFNNNINKEKDPLINTVAFHSLPIFPLNEDFLNKFLKLTPFTNSLFSELSQYSDGNKRNFWVDRNKILNQKHIIGERIKNQSPVYIEGHLNELNKLENKLNNPKLQEDSVIDNIINVQNFITNVRRSLCKPTDEEKSISNVNNRNKFYKVSFNGNNDIMNIKNNRMNENIDHELTRNSSANFLTNEDNKIHNIYDNNNNNVNDDTLMVHGNLTNAIGYGKNEHLKQPMQLTNDNDIEYDNKNFDDNVTNSTNNNNLRSIEKLYLLNISPIKGQQINKSQNELSNQSIDIDYSENLNSKNLMPNDDSKLILKLTENESKQLTNNDENNDNAFSNFKNYYQNNILSNIHRNSDVLSSLKILHKRNVFNKAKESNLIFDRMNSITESDCIDSNKEECINKKSLKKNFETVNFKLKKCKGKKCNKESQNSNGGDSEKTNSKTAMKSEDTDSVSTKKLKQETTTQECEEDDDDDELEDNFEESVTHAVKYCKQPKNCKLCGSNPKIKLYDNFLTDTMPHEGKNSCEGIKIKRKKQRARLNGCMRTCTPLCRFTTTCTPTTCPPTTCPPTTCPPTTCPPTTCPPTTCPPTTCPPTTCPPTTCPPTTCPPTTCPPTTCPPTTCPPTTCPPTTCTPACRTTCRTTCRSPTTCSTTPSCDETTQCTEEEEEETEKCKSSTEECEEADEDTLLDTANGVIEE